MTTINDRQVLAGYANETSEYLIGKNPDFSLDGWARSGATAAVTEIIGQNISKLFSSWGDVAAYRERRNVGVRSCLSPYTAANLEMLRSGSAFCSAHWRQFLME